MGEGNKGWLNKVILWTKRQSRFVQWLIWPILFPVILVFLFFYLAARSEWKGVLYSLPSFFLIVVIGSLVKFGLYLIPYAYRKFEILDRDMTVEIRITFLISVLVVFAILLGKNVLPANGIEALKRFWEYLRRWLDIPYAVVNRALFFLALYVMVVDLVLAVIVYTDSVPAILEKLAG